MKIEDLFQPLDPDEEALLPADRSAHIEQQSEAEFVTSLDDRITQYAGEYGLDLNTDRMRIHARMMHRAAGAYREFAQSVDIAALSPEEVADKLQEIVTDVIEQTPEATDEHKVAITIGFLKATAADYIQRSRLRALEQVADPTLCGIIELGDMDDDEFAAFMKQSNARVISQYGDDMPVKSFAPIEKVTTDLASHWRDLQQAREVGDMTAKEFRGWLDETMARLYRDNVENGDLPEDEWRIGSEAMRDAMGATWRNLRNRR